MVKTTFRLLEKANTAEIRNVRIINYSSLDKFLKIMKASSISKIGRILIPIMQISVI